MAEDIRENEMNSGVPVKMRGIDADGNSISPTLQEVADALPGEQRYDRGVYYSLPKPIVSIHKPTGGNETKTITLFKIEDYNTSHFNFFEIFTIPFYSNNHCLPYLVLEKLYRFITLSYLSLTLSGIECFSPAMPLHFGSKIGTSSLSTFFFR